MEIKGVITRILAVAGVVLVWFPVLAPFILALVRFASGGMFRFDYLMPAELFPAALAGGLMLLWAALRAHLHRGLIGWGLGCAVALLVGSQVLAVATGLASGRTNPSGWAWVLVISALIAYVLALVAVGVGGILLLRDLYRPSSTREENLRSG